VSFLVFKKYEFKIVGQLLTSAMFTEWVNEEGKVVLQDIFIHKKFRWFFGKKRARRTLYRAARIALAPKRPFAVQLKNDLNQLLVIIRKIGLAIKCRGYTDLYSADSTKALLVIPRGIVQHDFVWYLLSELAEVPQLGGFWGLSKRVLRRAALEAEKVFFDLLVKGRMCPDPEGKGILIGGDPDYAWKLNGMDGHYYFAYYGKKDNALSKKKMLNQFKSEMEEILCGQKIHLKRLEPHQVFNIAETFRGRK
jgi:hypothetical protein